jgi:hypothetical protein
MNKLDVLDFTIYHGKDLCKVTAAPYLLPARDGIPLSFELSVNGKNMGDLQYNEDKWQNDNIQDEELLEKIGSFINAQYVHNRTVDASPVDGNEKALLGEP